MTGSARVLRSGKTAILVYHAVAELDRDPYGIAITPEDFAGQMSVLADQFHLLSLRDLIGQLDRGGRIPHRSVVVTFDDGYANNWLAAAPVLQRYSVPATVFLATGYVAGQREYWWDECERLVAELASTAQVYELEINDETLPLEPADPAASITRIWSRLHRLEPRRVEEALIRLRHAAGRDGPLPPRPSHRPMSREELMCMVGAGIEIGAHTRHHSALAVLPDALVREEVEGSAADVEAMTGQRPQAFAYPFGAPGRDFVADTERIVRDAGFACAVTTRPGVVVADSPRFSLPRYFVTAEHGPEFESWLRSRFGGVARVARKVRRVSERTTPRASP